MDRNNRSNLKDFKCEDFQNQVSQVLVRHKSVLDIITKLDEYNARINRAIAKSVTSCGCISINANKQEFGNDSFEDMYSNAKAHIGGNICENCKDVVEEEMGAYLFYIASLCNTLGIELSSVLDKEYDRIKTLGIYSLK
jgi:NTP pyrophosphatase (non-canonical NTP hydrolase)